MNTHKAVRTFETLVYFNETTLRYITEGSNLHTRNRENLKSHTMIANYSNYICAC